MEDKVSITIPVRLLEKMLNITKSYRGFILKINQKDSSHEVRLFLVRLLKKIREGKIAVIKKSGESPRS